MALRSKSLFLYGFEVTVNNQYIPFKNSSGGSVINASIATGFYSLTSLIAAIQTAMNLSDPTNTYTVTADRSFSSGTQNRVSIATSGTYLSLLFSSGSLASASVRDLIGFAHTDRTGATTYQGTISAGTALQTDWYGKNYKPPASTLKNIGAVNISAKGIKEAITWSIMQFIEVEFENEAQAKVLAYWPQLIQWMIQQRPFDFTPETSSPSTVYSVTLDKTGDDGQGLAMSMKELVPDRPFMFTTGQLTFRVIPT